MARLPVTTPACVWLTSCCRLTMHAVHSTRRLLPNLSVIHPRSAASGPVSIPGLATCKSARTHAAQHTLRTLARRGNTSRRPLSSYLPLPATIIHIININHPQPISAQAAIKICPERYLSPLYMYSSLSLPPRQARTRTYQLLLMTAAPVHSNLNPERSRRPGGHHRFGTLLVLYKELRPPALHR